MIDIRKTMNFIIWSEICIIFLTLICWDFSALFLLAFPIAAHFSIRKEVNEEYYKIIYDENDNSQEYIPTLRITL